MRPLDWVVLVGSLTSIILYGLYRGRGSNTVDRYLLAGKTMPWYAMGLSIMATQASAITFISTTGQSYVDGMRFVQFYFGLPLAMIAVASMVVPRFHRARVYTAYEYLEQRFDREHADVLDPGKRSDLRRQPLDGDVRDPVVLAHSLAADEEPDVRLPRSIVDFHVRKSRH